MSGKSNRFYSGRSEARTAKIVGGAVQPNSGAGLFKKGDIKAEGILFDDKTILRQQKTRSLEKEWFEKISAEAFAQGIHMSAISFDYGDGASGIKYFAMDQYTFNQMYQAWRQLNYPEEEQ